MDKYLRLALFPLSLALLEASGLLIGWLPDFNQRASLYLMVWMVTWWVFEVLPLGITALIPLVYLPLLGLSPIREVTPSYSNPVIFLFLGGFMIARALEKTRLDERIALNILRFTGKSDRGIIWGFVIATGFLSMWISNTATTVMMVPIAMSVIHFLSENLGLDPEDKNLKTMTLVLLLSIAYSANIGGITTPVGTPPNVVFMGYLQELANREVDFWKWMAATIPVAVSLILVMVVFLCRLYPFTLDLPNDFSKYLRTRIGALGPINLGQRMTMLIFSIAAGLWVFKGVIHHFLGAKELNDTSIAIFAGVSLFILPGNLKPFQNLLDRKDIQKLPWDIVLLFGGGMALAKALQEAGFIEMATENLMHLNLANSYWLIFILAVVALMLTEIMSNVALCVVALPMIMKMGENIGVDPLLMAMPAALCSSFAFSMPISTPPNAIVFGTNKIRVKEMFRAGVILNAVAIIITMTIGYALIQFFLSPERSF